ncbi:MAG TPA: response regulator [Terriglobales bacterium]|nr:response regulator [Terriglobales bacterium]
MNKFVVEILLVEDNDNDIELTLHALRSEKLGNHIHVVRDGEEALAFLRSPEFQPNGAVAPPKVILLDLKLPKVSGLEVLRAVKGDPVLKLIPVVVLTSSKEEQDMVESYRLGVNSYLQKPVDFDSFRAMVKELGLYWLVINQPPPVVVAAQEVA